MKKYLLLALASITIYADNATPKNYTINTQIYYQSKSKITAEIATKINHINKYNRNNKEVYTMWANNKTLYLYDNDVLKFKKYMNKNAKIKCDYNQKNGKLEECRLISINEWKEI